MPSKSRPPSRPADMVHVLPSRRSTLLQTHSGRDTPAVPISAGLLLDVSRCFNALDSFSDGDASPIIRDITNASRIAATNGRTSRR